MEKGITSVWTSMGITSSPFVPAAERIRGRGGEDRRVPTRIGTGPLPTPEPPTAFAEVPERRRSSIYELGNFIDGKRSISDIRDAVRRSSAPCRCRRSSTTSIASPRPAQSRYARGTRRASAHCWPSSSPAAPAAHSAAR